LGYPQEKLTTIYYNNTGMVGFVKNPLFHKRTKYIDRKYYWVYEKIQVDKLTVEFLHTNEQTADILTKPLTHEKHEKHVIDMGLAPV
jgi:hypothetical protein